ncbi:MAG: flagellar basal body P-ring protein FlgI [Planctomycetes bacterium]|nr:flagellar basal body P-ring protein FlgI [Planctomycetota bacterium]
MRGAILLLASILASTLAAQDVSVRVKDIVTYKGTAANSLVGEGLVVGLKGSGDDKDKTTQKMLQAMSHKLNKSGLPASDYATKNIARVLVSVDVPAFKGQMGAALICRVSVLDKSKSIENGVLFATVLKNALDADDATEYAQASGRLALAQSGDKPKDPLNGTVRGSMLADIKVAFFTTAVDDYGKARKLITLLLDHPDSATANDIADRINENPALAEEEGVEIKADAPPPLPARAINDGVVEINIPVRWHGQEMKFKQIIDGVSVNPDLVATVTVDTSTGVLTFSGNVRVLPGAFTVKGISVTIGAGGEVPAKPAAGEIVKGATVPVNEPNLQLRQLIDTFNLLKLDAAEKTAVVRALEQNGMLQAKVVYE